MMTPRERVYATLNFNLPASERPPRQMWILPWALENFPGAYEQLQEVFPDDILHCPGHFTVPTEHLTQGNAYEIGTYVDEWNCVFENFQSGVIGEVKEPVVDDWDDISKVHFPVELLNLDVEKINEFCRGTDRFVLAGACPRIFERLQFIRGTENLLMDLAMEEEGLHAFIEKMHQFYLKELEAWSKTDVDALMFMDDWGWMQSTRRYSAWGWISLHLMPGKSLSGGRWIVSTSCRTERRKRLKMRFSRWLERCRNQVV